MSDEELKAYMRKQGERMRQAMRDCLGTPPIVCLCGSTRFKDAWHAEQKRLTHEGKIVLSVGDLDQSEAARTVNVPLDPDLKARLDVLHFRKIELADEVLILNVGGYIGQSTRNELAYARKIGKPVRFLEPEAGEEAAA